MGWTAIVTMLLAALGLVAPGGGAGEPPPGGEAPNPPGGVEPAPPGEIQAAPVRYEIAGDLPQLDGEEQAWTLGAEGGEVAARVAAVAEALGLDGEVEASTDGWQVVGTGGARLTVDRAPGLPWHHRPAGADGPDTPVEAPDEQIDCEMPPCPPGMMCAQVCPPRGGVDLEEPAPGGDVRSAEAAEVVARPVLAAAGLDLEQAAVTVDDVDGRWVVTAAPEVGGLPTAFLESSVTVGRDGAIGYASGWLAEPAPGESFELVGTDVALERLRAGQGGPPEAPEPDPDCGDDCFEPEVVTITGVRIGLQALWLDGDGPTWLVPSYLFAVERAGGSGVHAVVGVDDERFTPPSGPPVPEGCELIGGDAIFCPEAPSPPDAEAPPTDTEAPPTTAPPAGEATCRTAERDTLTLEACVSPTRPRVGEEVTIDVVARDTEEAVADDCASPLFSPDAGVDVPRCMIAFEPPPGAGPDEVRRTFTHAYERAGRHVPSVEVNASCTAEAPCRSLTVEVPLTVRR